MTSIGQRRGGNYDCRAVGALRARPTGAVQSNLLSRYNKNLSLLYLTESLFFWKMRGNIFTCVRTSQELVKKMGVSYQTGTLVALKRRGRHFVRRTYSLVLVNCSCDDGGRIVWFVPARLMVSVAQHPFIASSALSRRPARKAGFHEHRAGVPLQSRDGRDDFLATFLPRGKDAANERVRRRRSSRYRRAPIFRSASL